MKLMIAILTSNSIPHMMRLVDNMNYLWPVEGWEVEPVVVVNSTREGYWEQVLQQDIPFKVFHTASNGRPGRGKNSCMEVFLGSDCDYLYQIDGDDVLYPSAVKSIANHVNHYPCLDVLGNIPVDQIVNKGDHNAGHRADLGNNLEMGVWGTTYAAKCDVMGPGESHVFREELPSSVDYCILQSRKAAELVRMDEDLPVGEDHLFSYQNLALSQQGKLCFFHTMSSDFHIQDRTTPGSLQKIYQQRDSVELMKQRIAETVEQHRSSLNEVPCIYKELEMTQFDKEDFLREFIGKHPCV